jgi:hypothetical protein
MAALPAQSFTHRQNKDGSFDSICMTCYVTIASRNYVWELGRDELEHKCNPLTVATKSADTQPQAE